jgi:hypothetical protein
LDCAIAGPAIRFGSNKAKGIGGEKAMRNSFIVLIVAVCLCGPRWVQSASVPPTNQTVIVDFTQKAVARALDYDQGNRGSLMDAQDDFTSDGWREFMQWLQGYLDDKGAPTGSSRFTSTGDPIVKHQENGVTRLTIPGTLKQESKNAHGGISRAIYRVAIDVRVGGDPLKIQHLKARICGGASTECQ